MDRTAVILAVCLLAAGLTGCLGDADDAAGSPPSENGDRTDGAAPDEVRTLATSPGTVSVLGLAIYEGIDPASVAPYVPGEMTPTDCIDPATPDRVDVIVIVGQRSYPEVPGDAVASVQLIGCAERPEGLAREDANEPPWVGLTGWLDGDAHAAFLSRMGFPTQQATVTFEAQAEGYSVAAERNGSTLLEGQFARSPVGVPAFDETRCEPVPMDGRSIVEARNGSLVALDWNKTEAICPAQASLTWPEDSPVADLLGPAHAPDIAVDVDVEEARYWWRSLPAAGG